MSTAKKSREYSSVRDLRLVQSEAPQRLVAIDHLRGFAFLLMAVTHTYRLQPLVENATEQAPYFRAAFDWFMQVEPFTLALFCFLSAWSVVLAKPSFKGALRRSLSLILISSVLFFFNFGFQFPDIFISSGPLFIMGAITFIFNTWPTSPDWKRNLAFLTLLTVAASIALQETSSKIQGLDTGNGPLLPTLIFGIFGFWFGMSWLRFPRAIAVGAAIAGIACLLPGPWTEDKATSFYLYPGLAATGLDWLQGFFGSHAPVKQDVIFWEYTVIGTIRMFLPLVIFCGAFLIKLNRPIVGLGWLSFFGKNSLSGYLVHLALIAVVYESGWHPSNALATAGTLVAIVFSTYWILRFRQTLQKVRAPKGSSAR